MTHFALRGKKVKVAMTCSCSTSKPLNNLNLWISKYSFEKTNRTFLIRMNYLVSVLITLN